MTQKLLLWVEVGAYAVRKSSVDESWLYFFAWSWEVREPEISCAGALCRLTSGDFPLRRVVLSTTTGEIGKKPQKYRLWRSFSAGVPAGIILAFAH
jgi:hypothetical protein